MIPRNIFQTHKSHEYIHSDILLLDATNSWKKDTSFNYCFYNDKQCHEFMKDFFPDILDVYEKIPLNVMKSDLWRYCVIYQFGGIYADTDTFLKTEPTIFINNIGKYLTVVPENNTDYCQYIFSAPQNSPILKSIIDLSVQRIRTTIFFEDKKSIVNLTGKGVFTDGILSFFKKIYGDKNGSIPQKGELLHSHKFTNILEYIHIYDFSLFHFTYIHHYFKGGWCNNKVIKIQNFNNKKVIFFGESSINIKVIPFPYDSTKNYLFKLCETDYNDTFSFKLDNNCLLIKRTDSNEGWGNGHSLYFFDIPSSTTYIEIGRSKENIKKIPFHANPNKTYSFELFKHKYDDTFSFTIINNYLIVKRVDSMKGWNHEHYVYIMENV